MTRRWNASSFVLVFHLPCITSFLVSKCLFGEMYDMATNSCVDCEKGYSGPSFTIRCPFPGYGKACQLTCRCVEEECDAVSGCIYSTTRKRRRTETETKMFLRTGFFGMDLLSTPFPKLLNSFQSKDLLTHGNHDNEQNKNITRQTGIGVLSCVLVILVILFAAFIYSRRKYCQESHEEKYEIHYEDIKELKP